MDNISEIDLTTAIKNCKVLIVIMSDQFEKNAKCRDMLIYAKEILNKDILVVVSGESMEWQSKDIGMKIGAQEVRHTGTSGDFLPISRSQISAH